jgi:hypothetical protein
MTAPDLIMAITRLIQGADNQSNNKGAFQPGEAITNQISTQVALPSHPHLTPAVALAWVLRVASSRGSRSGQLCCPDNDIRTQASCGHARSRAASVISTRTMRRTTESPPPPYKPGQSVLRSQPDSTAHWKPLGIKTKQRPAGNGVAVMAADSAMRAVARPAHREPNRLMTYSTSIQTKG